MARCCPRSPACRRCAPRARRLHDVFLDRLFLNRTITLLPDPRPAAAAPRWPRRFNRRVTQLADVKVIFRQRVRCEGHHTAAASCRAARQSGRTGDPHQRDEAHNLANHTQDRTRTPDGAAAAQSFFGHNIANRNLSYGHRTAKSPRWIGTGRHGENTAARRRRESIVEQNYGWLDRLWRRFPRRLNPRGDRPARQEQLSNTGVFPSPPPECLLHRRSFSGLEGQPVHRRARRATAGAARTRWREGHQRGASPDRLARAHPRCAAGPRRHDLAADRQRQRAGAPRDAGKMITRSDVTART